MIMQVIINCLTNNFAYASIPSMKANIIKTLLTVAIFGLPIGYGIATVPQRQVIESTPVMAQPNITEPVAESVQPATSSPVVAATPVFTPAPINYTMPEITPVRPMPDMTLPSSTYNTQPMPEAEWGNRTPVKTYPKAPCAYC